MRKITIGFLLLSALLFITPAHTLAAPGDLSAAASILVEANSGYVLYEHNADQPLKIASTTKVLTALVVLAHCGIDDVVTIRPEHTGAEGSSMYLKAGETFTVRELLYGLLLASGNDAAVALACHTAQTVENFAYLMNTAAQALGCTNSSFKNPHGLDAEGHYSTARDMALITAAAMDNKLLAEIASTRSISFAGRSFRNHNKLLWSYEGTIGGKTGYTKSSGRTLVSCAQRDGVRLICVTLSDPNDWADHTALYNWGFESVETVSVDENDDSFGPLTVISGGKATVSVRPAESRSYTATRGDGLTLDAQLPQFAYAAVREGEQAGSIRVLRGGEEIDEIPLVFGETVELDPEIPLTRWERIKWAWYFANRSQQGIPRLYGHIY